MKYEVLLLPSAQKDLDDFSGKLLLKLRELMAGLSRNPRPLGSLKLTAENGYRIRVSSYRILYRIDDKEKKVFVYRVRHRREVYR